MCVCVCVCVMASLVVAGAGDVASGTGKLREALQCAKNSMDEVFLVPGNHDCWVSGSMMHQ
jgi:calcineurin-like phosphoesterase family protein